jgi:PTS system nitrogen regulatory IIA component
VSVVFFRAIRTFVARMGGLARGFRRQEAKAGSKPNTIGALLLPEDILLDIDVAGKSELIEEIGRHTERAHGMPHQSVAVSLSYRERIGSTGLGEGVAIPHARIKDLDHIQVVYMRLKLPIPFDAPDGKPVSDILVLLVPKQAAEEHLKILAEASRMFSDRRFRERLHLCRHPREVKRLFETWPERLF